MKITVHFIRHGESRANKLQNTFGMFHCCLRDPSLTPKGKKETLRNPVPYADYVCCSELLRAKQTAQLAYKNKLIYVLPGVEELGLGLDNLPLNIENQFDSYADMSKFITLRKDNSKTFIDYLYNNLLKKNHKTALALQYLLINVLLQHTRT